MKAIIQNIWFIQEKYAIILQLLNMKLDKKDIYKTSILIMPGEY